ncbi:lipase 1-like isoform X3 [Tenebrio molitor]|uniref:lipase 1-like isoform X3 n=1 Tax=Tenebrio molitor TaxID=7067 RepID=UPI003624A85C
MLLKYLILLSALQPILRCSTSNRNNVCTTFRDYYNPDGNKNCYYDPDTTLEIPAIIQKYANALEIHKVITNDGYILTLFRIPRTNPKGVILLHHSIATHSQIYLWQGNQSLAITLWRNGFDVWLANQRGTSYSDKHVTLSIHDFRYWNFYIQEMGLYDVSAEIKLIREKTNGRKVIFFGHSLGSAIGLVYSSLKVEEAKNYLKSMILLAPPCYFEHVTSVIILFKHFVPVLEAFTNTLRMGSPLIILPFLLPISRVILRLFPAVLFVTFFNYDAAIYGNNFSWKTIIHFLQLATLNHRFQMYDYGKERNMKIYGEEIPPLYPIGKISVPTLIVSSDNDSLITQQDSESLFKELSSEAKVHGHWKLSRLNHLDYHIGLHRKEIFMNDLLTFLNNL